MTAMPRFGDGVPLSTQAVLVDEAEEGSIGDGAPPVLKRSSRRQPKKQWDSPEQTGCTAAAGRGRGGKRIFAQRPAAAP